MIPDASATMLPAALQYAAPSASAAAPGRGPGLAGDVEDALRALLPMLREVPTGRSSDCRLKICGVLCDDMTVAPVATATSNLKHLRELV